jgi:hypothetical protein
VKEEAMADAPPADVPVDVPPEVAAEPPPTIERGNIQTVLELTFPDLYTSILLPTDIDRAKAAAEELAATQAAAPPSDDGVCC